MLILIERRYTPSANLEEMLIIPVKRGAPTPDLPDEALIRLDRVLELIPVSRSTFFAGQKRGLFPPSIPIGPRSRAFRYGAVLAWLADPQEWARQNAKDA